MQFWPPVKRIVAIATPLMLVTIATSACLSPSASRLKHEDVPNERGADEAEPWHFHTGEGIRINEFEDERLEKKSTTSSSCDVLADDAEAYGCKERVYFFARSDIDQIVQSTTKVMDSEVQKHGANATAGAALAAATLVGSGVLTVAPEPVVSKTGAVIAYAISAGFATYSVYEFSKAVSISQQLKAIAKFMEDEELFTKKCKHVRKDFLEKAAGFGITFKFPRNAGQFISPKYYQQTLKEEQELYRRVSDLAVTKRLPTHKAYEQFFRDECGQLPVVNINQEDREFNNPNSVIPMDIKAQAIRLDQALKLLSNIPVSFSNFSSGDVYSNDQKDSLFSFLVRWRSDIDRIEDLPPEHPEKKNLENLRIRVHQILIKTAPQPWSTFGGKRTPFEWTQKEGKNYLTIFATRTGSFYPVYEVSHAEAMKELFGFGAVFLTK